MDAYVKLFHEQTLDYCDLIAEDVLVNVCHHGIIEDYRVYLIIFGSSGGCEENQGMQDRAQQLIRAK